jgi:aryl-alcohol dehydrogenase-like predicted oxidoreductase
MALGYARSRFFTTAVIIGATNLDQLAENIDAATVTLDPAVIAAIDAIHRSQPNPAP